MTNDAFTVEAIALDESYKAGFEAGTIRGYELGSKDLSEVIAMLVKVSEAETVSEILEASAIASDWLEKREA